jgi:muramidase (phage lysozyme)
MIEKMNSMLGNPNVKTFLDFLAKAEGGDYNVVVGGGTFDDFSKHPGRVGLRTKEGPSTAAGRYQITKTTFDDVAPKLGLKDFSPRSQDLAAVYLLQRRGALEDVAGGNWDEAINKLGKEWASLPTSKYQQPKKTWDYVRENLSEKTVVAGASADAVGSKEDVSTPVVSTAEPESVFAAVSTPATAPETRTMDQPGVAKVEELPETYRLALAANYLADTEDESVTERAVQMIEEREEAARGGAGKIPALAAFGGGNQQAVDPFQFVLQREEQQAEPRRRPVPKMPVRFAEGGEASSEDAMPDVLANLTESEKQEYLRALIANHLRAQVGPMNLQAVPKNKELEGRISTDVYGVRPYVDVDASGAISEYGAKYGQMGPQGGYEVGVSQAVPIRTGQGKIRMPVVAQGAYSIPVGKMGSLQAGGFYIPRQGEMPESAYGANLTYQQKFAEGGEVSPADLMEQMSVGTLPEDQTPGAVQKVGKDLLRGAQYLPYDLLGMPVDLAALAMQPFGYKVDKPVMGSEWLIDKAANVGIADRPTGSTAETVSRIGMGFVNPAMVGRQLGRGVESLKDVVTAPIDRAKIQAAASKVPEDVAYDPLRNRLESEGILSLAVKPGGGGVDVYNPVMGLKGNAYLTALEKYNRRTEGNAPGTKDPNFMASPEAKQAEDITDWLDNKATAYFEKQYGSPNDPLFKAFLEGKYSPPALTLGSKRDILFPPDRERIQAARNMLRDPDPEYQQSGRRILSSYYDKATPIITEMGETAVRNRLINPRYRNEIDQYIRDDRQLNLDSLSASEMDSILDRYAKTGAIDSTAPFTEKDIVTGVTKSAVDGLINKIDIQGGVAGKEVGGMLQRRRLADDPEYPTEQQKADIRQGEPIYTVPEGAHNDIVERQELTNYMFRTPKEQWERMSFPELVLKAENDYRGITDPIDIYNRIDNYKPVTVEQRLIGTKGYMPVKSDSLGNGAGWREIVDEGGLLIEGRLLKHCLSEDKKYASFLKNDMSKFFSLRDKNGKAYATIQLDRLGVDGPFANVHQIKGFKDKSVAKEYEKEITDFLTQYEKQVGIPLRYTEDADFVPKAIYKSSGPENYAKGGMVDKPLYDRAA